MVRKILNSCHRFACIRIASRAKQSSHLAGDCFVAKNAPRSDISKRLFSILFDYYNIREIRTIRVNSCYKFASDDHNNSMLSKSHV